jgi:hypothetical protein
MQSFFTKLYPNNNERHDSGIHEEVMLIPAVRIVGRVHSEFRTYDKVKTERKDPVYMQSLHRQRQAQHWYAVHQ